MILIGVGLAEMASPQTFTEFPIPLAGTFLGGITAGPDGNLWFTETPPRIGRMSPSGVLTEFYAEAFSGASGIAAGPDGNLWFTDMWGPKIGRITTAGDMTAFSLPPDSDPVGIAAGPDGNLWFTEYYGSRIGRITPTGVVTRFPIPGDVAPWGITAGPDGNLWFTEVYGPQIGRITTAGIVTQFPIPSHRNAIGITAGPDGNLWFTDGSGGIGRITTAGAVTQFPTASSRASSGITTGSDGNLWFTAGDQIGKITTSGVVTEFHVPTNSSLGEITAGSDGNLWFTDNGGDRIGRIRPTDLAGPHGPSGPCVADSATLCLNEGRFRAQAEWQAPGLGTSGLGTALPLTSNTGSFWFFDPTNIEVVVKVLNGCAINRHPWVFAGGLTNVGVTMTVTDTQTGLAETYLSPANIPFQPIQDTSAFSPCP